MIFRHAGLIDQFAFAMACKKLLQASALLRLRIVPIGPLWSYKTLPGKIKLLHYIGPPYGPPISSYRATKIELLYRIGPPVGHPEKRWVICHDCLKYRMTNETHWNKKKTVACPKSDWKSVVQDWKHNYSEQCPDCWYDQNRELYE